MKIFHNPEIQQITIADERYYSRDNETWYPSVNYVLDEIHRGVAYDNWLKANGFNADVLMMRAADQGTKVHNMIEAYNNGLEPRWLDDNGKEVCTINEWKMLHRAVEFFELYVANVVVSECRLLSDELGVGGTVDAVLELNESGKDICGYSRILCDYKTSNDIHEHQEVQIATYMKAWNDTYSEMQVDNRAILWVNGRTRGADKKGKKIQGEGWELYFPERTLDKDIELFHAAKLWWDIRHPNPVPKNKVYPDRVSKNVKLYSK